MIEFRLEVKKGIIEQCKIFGDFFGVGDVAELEQLLAGVQYDKKSIENALDQVNVAHYFGNVTKEEIVHLIY